VSRSGRGISAQLVGRWSDKDGGDIWEFAKSDDNAYAITPDGGRVAIAGCSKAGW
jgi:hypothetical protein